MTCVTELHCMFYFSLSTIVFKWVFEFNKGCQKFIERKLLPKKYDSLEKSFILIRSLISFLPLNISISIRAISLKLIWLTIVDKKRKKK